jgi:predicted nucleotidyltransferase component of viral defense system
MIPQRNISLISNQLAKQNPNGTRIPEKVIERDYCLAWFLVGLYRCELGKHLAFKGGTALRRCHFGEYRFSEDLDFTLLKSDLTLTEIEALLPQVFDNVRDSSGIEFNYAGPDEPHQNSHTFYLEYLGPLQKKATVKVDTTINELIVRPLVSKPVIKTYEQFSDLPEDEPNQVYAAEEVVIEKIAALTDKARQQPRDLYDLWYLMEVHGVELEELLPDLAAKLEFKGRSIDEVMPGFIKKEAVLGKLWQTRLSEQVADLPEFEGVYRYVQRSFRQAGLGEVDNANGGPKRR